MTETPLIRRQTTADRGVKAVTAHEVLACIKELTGETFSTRICGHLIARYWPQLTVEQITDMAELMPQSEGA